tara:strand:- start:5675 stop:8095 length:2421 start_codon:yes stop_codon:yes gene_type:complete
LVLVFTMICLSISNNSFAADTAPGAITQFTEQYCSTCHNADEQKGDFQIDTLPWDLIDTDTREQWELVRDYISEGDMPPKKAKAHPDEATKQKFLTHLENAFAKADQSAKPGGTPVRRLNRNEYLNTVRDLFGMRMIDLPLSFPEDATSEEFDTMPAGLFLSPAVMEAYHETATDIADRFVPLPNPLTYRSNLTTETIGGDQARRWFGPKGEFLKFTGFNHSGWVGALWDSSFVAPSSGIYRIKLHANAQAESGADGNPLRLGLHAFDPTEEQLPKRYRIDRTTLVAEVEIPAGDPTWIECDVPVEAGETLHIYCSNRLPADAYRVSDQNRNQINKDLTKINKRPEPTVELRGLKIEGPFAVPPRVVEFFGAWPPSLDREELETKLLPLAERTFRRPLTDAESEKLIAAVLQHGNESGAGKPEFAWHYAIRRLLCSPQFLYREAENAEHLSDHALASRLSYFLWSTMPDAELFELASAGKLSEPGILAAQTKRLLADPRSQQFVKHFTGQWLGNRTVQSINVCDNRYPWNDTVRYGFVRSTEMFFEEVLRDNLPISTFIDSDFTYANSAMQVIWGMKPKRDKSIGAVDARQRQSLVWPEPERVSFADSPDLPRHVLDRGGVLGLPGVLTVTGDGVESSPILRGVWVLENLFGQHPPPPPKDVPALDIDTSQATSVRETLKAHTELETCAKCHRDIDPLGLALENYDAIGGWRTKYVADKTPIDASAAMPDGTALNGAPSIKRFLKERPEVFTHCLLTKLLEYGAGRELSVGDQRIVEALVKAEPPEGYRFGDLIRLAIQSEVFRAK